jgi:hypothetical protein
MIWLIVGIYLVLFLIHSLLLLLYLDTNFNKDYLCLCSIFFLMPFLWGFFWILILDDFLTRKLIPRDEE